MSDANKPDRLWMAILAGYCIYAALFILRTSFVLDGERYFSLFDDAMISMTYARNLAHGQGLVWNPGGERVEGITNLAWTLYMALLHLIPLAKSKISLLVQATSAVLLLVSLVFVKRIAQAISEGSRFVWVGAVVLSAFYMPTNNWSLQGMEVGLLILLVGLAVDRTIRAIQSGRFSLVPYAILALAMLVRLDMAVPFAVVLVFMAATDRENRKKHITFGLAFFGVAVASQTIFRVLYYGDLLPNTYYQKLTGYPFLWRITRGLYVTFVFIWRMNWIFFLVPVSLLFMKRSRPERLLACLVGGQLAYSIFVGGDAWENWGGANRYVCIAMPCFFILFCRGLDTIGERIKAYLTKCRPGLAAETGARYIRRAAVALVLVSLASFNAIYGPAALTQLLLLKRPLHVDDNERMAARGLAIAKITGQRARVAVVWDGAIPYFSERYAISILGKNDRKIAREPMKTFSGPKKLVAFYPGHLKWDYPYSIGQLKPDVVAQLWQNPETAAPYLNTDYLQVRVGGFGMHLKSGSPNIRWDRVSTLSPNG